MSDFNQIFNIFFQPSFGDRATLKELISVAISGDLPM